MDSLSSLARYAQDSPEAARLFLRECCTFQPDSVKRHRDEIMAILESIIRLALALRPDEEIEFKFTREGDTNDKPSRLKSPDPVWQLLTYLTGAEWSVGLARATTLGDCAKSDGGYALRITTNLVTFGGIVIWRASVGE